MIDDADDEARNCRHAALGQGSLVVELKVDGLVPARVHQVECPGLRSATGREVWHPVAYYTLNALP